MSRRRMAVIAVTSAVIAGGAGVAVAGTGGEEAREAEQSILQDAAKRLGTSTEQLREALGAAQDAQLDRAVKDGDLTQTQADRIKERREASGRVLGVAGGRGGHHGPGGPGFGRGAAGNLLGDVAEALDMTRAELRTALRDGDSIADVARKQGTSLESVRTAVRTAAGTRLDKAVADGDLTRAQADAALEHVDEHLARLDEAGGGFGRRGFGPPPGDDERGG